MNKFFVLLIVLLIITISYFTYIHTKSPNTITIGITTWIGYTPLIYADKKGWLDDIKVDLTMSSSLGENKQLFEYGYIDILAATQYEFQRLNKDHNLSIFKLLDRSNGGDVIMSNKTIDEIKDSTEIYVYLEIDSINKIMLEDFMHKFNIPKNNIILINKSQELINIDRQNTQDKTILIVTYIPHNFRHEKNGFKETMSTKCVDDILVVDTLISSKDYIDNHKVQLDKLSKLIDKAIEVFNTNPKEYYATISPNIKISYEEFLKSSICIKWINIDNEKIKKKLEKYRIK